MSKIHEIHAREILDSRGDPALEAEVVLESGIMARASVPSGASIGKREALELRDGDPKRYGGLGVRHAVENVRSVIAPELEGMDVIDQGLIDRAMIELDGTGNKEKLGANAVLGVSLACARAAAEYLELPLFRYLGGVHARRLPVPMMNVFNGGLHSSAGIALQEFMIRPKGAESFSEGLRMGSEIFHTLKSLLKKHGLSTAVGDEGGFAPSLSGGAEKVLEILAEAVTLAGFQTGRDATFALDCAAGSFCRDGVYDYTLFEGPASRKLSREEQAEYLAKLVRNYPVDSIEDGMAEDDPEGWKILTEKLGGQCQLVGDDLFVTNAKLLAGGIAENLANAVLIKPNQIGTLTETLDTVETARKAGYGVIVSHRSGETGDTFIADLTVAVNAGQIKTGSLSRSERICKYNRLLRIEEMLGDLALYGA